MTFGLSSFLRAPPVSFSRVIPRYSFYGFPRYLSLRVCPGISALIGFPRVPMGYPPVLYGFCPVHLYAGQLPLSLSGWSLSWGIPHPQRSDFIKERSRPPSFFHTLVFVGTFWGLSPFCLATAPCLLAKLIDFLTILPPGIPSHTPRVSSNKGRV